MPHLPRALQGRRSAAVLLPAAALVVLTAAPHGAQAVPAPDTVPSRTVALAGGGTLTGPVPTTATSHPFGSFATTPTTVDLGAAGYVEREYFLSGTARSYAASGTLSPDGRWAATPDGSAPYTTRMLVEQPRNPKKFNGTVLVEWTNVTASADLPIDWGYTHEELLREGYGYVAVSAQYVGVEGGLVSPVLPRQIGLKQYDPTRYANLSHPGDTYSYDIFSQAGSAVAAAFPGSTVRTLLADGESQSAGRMVTYVDAVHPLAQVYDGFLVHSRGARGAPLNQQAPGSQSGFTDANATQVPTPSLIRSDSTTPVLQAESETDVVGPPGLGFVAARQPDTDRLRTWEMAGTSHVDHYDIDLTITPVLVRDVPDFPPSGCVYATNDGQEHQVLNAGLAALRRWAGGGAAPAHSPQLQVAGSGTDYERDALGNAVGGIRTPAVDAPTSTLSGIGNTAAPGSSGAFCRLYGSTVPFSDAQLDALYDSSGDYVSQVRASARIAQRQGFLLPKDVRQIVQQASGPGAPLREG